LQTLAGLKRTYYDLESRGIFYFMRRIIWLITIILFISAIALGYLGWRQSRTATIVIEWSTASELDTAGFNILRSDDPDGTFTQINDLLIPASPDPLTGGSYEYQDTQVEAGRVYYYELEDVEVNGSTTRHGPIEVEAKSGGIIEIISAIFLGVISLFSGYYMWRPSRTEGQGGA